MAFDNTSDTADKGTSGAESTSGAMSEALASMVPDAASDALGKESAMRSGVDAQQQQQQMNEAMHPTNPTAQNYLAKTNLQIWDNVANKAVAA